MDNCICDIKIGLASQASHAGAFFDSLIFGPGISGTAGLKKERELLQTLPVSLIHHVGLEFSYYGQHINCFGSTVPIPNYEQLLPHRFSSCEVVEHIRDHGGLASINHLEIDNMDKTVEQIAANKWKQ